MRDDFTFLFKTNSDQMAFNNIADDDDDMMQFYTRRMPKQQDDGTRVVSRQEPIDPVAAAIAAVTGDRKPASTAAVSTTPTPAADSDAGEEKAVCGFLFSFSRIPDGEYWVVREGGNTIGLLENSDICLEEATVEKMHAVLHVDKTVEGLQATLTDMGSRYGTKRNGLRLTASVSCHDRDIITIGEHYELLLILVDERRYGLRRCDLFRLPGAEDEGAGLSEDEGTIGFDPDELDTDATRVM